MNTKGFSTDALFKGLCRSGAALGFLLAIALAAAFCPPLADFTHRGKWIYEDSLKDEHLADRLRWQFWTMRYE